MILQLLSTSTNYDNTNESKYQNENYHEKL